MKLKYEWGRIMESKQYCKGYGLNCNQCNYEKCIDSRGKYKQEK